MKKFININKKGKKNLCDNFRHKFLNVVKIPGRSKRESVKKIKYASSHVEGSQNETNRKKKKGTTNSAKMLFLVAQCTEVRFASFLSGEFITAIVVNPWEKTLVKPF